MRAYEEVRAAYMRVFDFDGTIYDGESLFDLYLFRPNTIRRYCGTAIPSDCIWPKQVQVEQAFSVIDGSIEVEYTHVCSSHFLVCAHSIRAIAPHAKVRRLIPSYTKVNGRRPQCAQIAHLNAHSVHVTFGRRNHHNNTVGPLFAP